ncbi:hypothetical protein LCGC14_0717720 [marine sediment metagenome]|uniref:Minor tail T domain-containing protein n=1 Tax=marine sediment metagenome TaxID=412755 RepID=A0A0F9QYF9_9ZZZZ
MLKCMTAKDLREWEIYYELEPFGAPALNLNFGRLLALFMNIHRGKGTSSVSAESVTFGDFAKRGIRQSVEEMKSVLMALVKEGKD